MGLLKMNGVTYNSPTFSGGNSGSQTVNIFEYIQFKFFFHSFVGVEIIFSFMGNYGGLLTFTNIHFSTSG